MNTDKKDIRPAKQQANREKKQILIPEEVLRENIQNNLVMQQMYITEIGLYPETDRHFSTTENGCPELVLIVCVSGQGIYKTEAGTFHVMPGQFLMLFPNEKHQYESDEADPWSIYRIKIGGVNISEFCDQPLLRKCRIPSDINDVAEVHRLLNNLTETLESGHSHKDIMYANLTLQRIMALIIYGRQESRKETKKLSEDVISFMKENMGEKYFLTDLANKFFYSTSQFSCIFKKETGYSPIEFAIQMKMHQACHLLKNTDLKIYEIGLHIGYKDPYHFSKIFKMIKNVSPEQFRISLENRDNSDKNKAHPV